MAGGKLRILPQRSASLRESCTIKDTRSVVSAFNLRNEFSIFWINFHIMLLEHAFQTICGRLHGFELVHNSSELMVNRFSALLPEESEREVESSDERDNVVLHHVKFGRAPTVAPHNATLWCFSLRCSLLFGSQSERSFQEMLMPEARLRSVPIFPLEDGGRVGARTLGRGIVARSLLLFAFSSAFAFAFSSARRIQEGTFLLRHASKQ